MRDNGGGDRVWVSRDVEFWAEPEDILYSCGVASGAVLAAYMEPLDLNHETPAGDPEERRARIRDKLKRKRVTGPRGGETTR